MPRSNVRSSLRLAAMAALMAGAGLPALAQQAQTGTPPAGTSDAAPTQPPAQAPAEAPTQAPAQTQAPAPAPTQGQPQGQQPQPQVVATHGEWSVLCLDGKPPCIMRQVGYNADKREVMEVSIRRIEPQQTQQGTVEAVMDVRVPLGVFLREGLSLQIDGGQAQRGQYSICLQEGCLMREPLPNAIVSSLKKGATAKFGFVVPQGQGGQTMESELSLSGFTAAYNALGEKK